MLRDSMINNQFCFIICTNNDLYIQECMLYISELIVPEGYTIDILTIKDAKSITSGYNEAMKASRAKYKIYMHQDVFIINKYFLVNLLNIFNFDSRVGMIGMVGAPSINDEAIMWSSIRVGGILKSEDLDKPYVSEIDDTPEASGIVSAIDGFLMATCVDIPWREDLFDGWDFYDMSQSMEFKKRGYLIVVPSQNRPWCLHDDGGMLNFFNYNHYRRIFIKEYMS